MKIWQFSLFAIAMIGLMPKGLEKYEFAAIFLAWPFG